MLGNEDRQIAGRAKRAEHQPERVDPAGRCADCDHLDLAGAQHGARARKGAFGQGQGRSIIGRAGIDIGVAAAECADLAEQLAAVILVEAAGAGLQQGVSRPHRQCGERVLGPVHRQRGDHQHLRVCRRGKDRGQGVEPAHPGHFQIEQHNVRRFGSELGNGALGAAGRAGEHQRGIAFDHALEDRAHGKRIIDDHHPDRARAARRRELFRRACAAGEQGRAGRKVHAKPTSCSLIWRVS